MSPLALPERLRRELAADPSPVRPLPPPAVRALDLAVWAIAVFLLVPLLLPLRHDAESLGWWLVWGVAAGQGLAGLWLVALALREAVPGGGIGAARSGLALAAGAAIQLGVGLATWLGGPASQATANGRHGALTCFSAQGTLGFTGLAFTLWLIVRAWPVRPRWAGALAGMGAGLVADGVWHVVCPRSDLAHVLVGHGGATIAMTSVGWLLGVFWEVRAVRAQEKVLGLGEP